MSRPMITSMSEDSSTVKVTGKKDPPSLSCARWMRPRIFPEPTPLAMPCQRSSMSRAMPQRSAYSWLMMVICAPESTKAFMAVPLISQFT